MKCVTSLKGVDMNQWEVVKTEPSSLQVIKEIKILCIRLKEEDPSYFPVLANIVFRERDQLILLKGKLLPHLEKLCVKCC